MTLSFLQKNLAWLEARISEAEKKIAIQKMQLALLEDKGLNTAHACRILAVTTEYLRLLNVRHDAAVEELRLLGQAGD